MWLLQINQSDTSIQSLKPQTDPNNTKPHLGPFQYVTDININWSDARAIDTN